MFPQQSGEKGQNRHLKKSSQMKTRKGNIARSQTSKNHFRIKNKISIEDLLNTAMSSSSSQAQSTANSLMNLVMQFRKVM